jgi:hypothetical protein
VKFTFFYIILNYHKSAHKKHCHELGVVAVAGPPAVVAASHALFFLDEAADHKCTTKNKRCKDEELTFLYSVEFILRIREVHISSTLVKIFLLDGLLFYFLLTLYSSRCRNVIMLGVHSHILDRPAVFSREPSVRPRPLAH